MPESIFVSAPLENGRLHAGNCDVFVVIDCCTYVTFVENGDIFIINKHSDAEE